MLGVVPRVSQLWWLLLYGLQDRTDEHQVDGNRTKQYFVLAIGNFVSNNRFALSSLDFKRPDLSARSPTPCKSRLKSTIKPHRNPVIELRALACTLHLIGSTRCGAWQLSVLLVHHNQSRLMKDFKLDHNRHSISQVPSFFE